MRTVEKFPNRIKEIENRYITLKDGCHLAARIWLPEDAEKNPVPAVLEYLPYRKRDGTAVRDQLTHPYMAGHGYACVRVDMRGNGESDGLMWDEYLKQEQDDAIEVIDWLTKQPWCSGTVGMIGISWGGFNGLQVAMRRPPALKAVITVDSTVDRYADDIHYKGGCLLNENLGWSTTMLSYSSRPPDPVLVGQRWRDMWLVRLKNEPLLLENWLRHQHRDAFWKHGSVCEDWSAIQAAVLAVGGWADAYSNAVPQLCAKLKAPVKGIVGPWLHKYPHFAVPGPAIGFLQEAVRWWDRWLKDKQNGVDKDPLYTAYMQDSMPPKAYYKERPGRWVAEDKWPSKNVKPLRFKLNRGTLDSRAQGPVALALSSPQNTGIAAGEYCPIWLGAEQPVDQRLDDGGSLLFDTGPLKSDIEILGAPVVELELAVDRPQANIALRLCDVFPGGESTRVTYGVLNLCHRDSHEKPSPLKPGKRYRVRLQLDDAAYRFPKGHRIRLAVSNSYWPLIWPSPEPVLMTLFTGAKSELTLPVRGKRKEKARPFPPPEAAPPLQQRRIREASNYRTVETDIASGESVLRIVDDFGEAENLAHGLIAGSIGRETYRIRPDDPLSALAETHWTQTLRRGDWSVRTEAMTMLKADKEFLHVTGSVEAFEDGKLVHEKKWNTKIKRELV
jgi:putative CocE/NonD family hydrolase